MRRGQRRARPAAQPALDGAVPADMPAFIKPQLATEVSTLPEGEWMLQGKLDGYRLMVRIDGADVRLLTRNGHDWTAKMPVLARELASLDMDNAWLDGEVVALGRDDLPDFGTLQEAFATRKTDGLLYFGFDLLYLNGFDLREVALQKRVNLLEQLLTGNDLPHVRYTAFFPFDVDSVLTTACKLKLEGILAKRADAPYVSARNRDWLKLKCNLRQEFVIGGFSSTNGAAAGLDRLLLGVEDNSGKLNYCGAVIPTLKGPMRASLLRKLTALRIPSRPFANEPDNDRKRKLVWVKPELLAEVSFMEWTRDGHIRHASFHGLRDDKPATEIRRESVSALRTSVGSSASRARGNAVASVVITHPERELDPVTGLTKGDLVSYAEAIAPWALPHISSRPVALVRAPAGLSGERFFQKHAEGMSFPGMTLLPPELYPNHQRLLNISSTEALVGAAQMNVLEIHAWNASVPQLDRPDRIILDLDPDPELPWSSMQEAARLVKLVLDELALDSWIKTSGSKGYHVVVPLGRYHSWDEAKAFSHAIAKHFARVLPNHFSAVSGPKNRVRKIFIDYLRNGKGASTIAAFSTRAKSALTVSMPVSWEELEGVTRADQWTMRTAIERMQHLSVDPWDGYWTSRQRITAAMWRALNARPPSRK